MKDVEMLERGFTEEKYIRRKPDRAFDPPVNPFSKKESELVKRLCLNYALKTYSYTADSMGLVASHERVPGSNRIPDCEQDGFIFFERCILKFDKNKYDSVTIQLMEDEDPAIQSFTLENLFNEFFATQARFGLKRDMADYNDSLKREVKIESEDAMFEGEFYADTQSSSTHLLEQLSRNGSAIENQEIKALSSMIRGNVSMVNFFILKFVEEVSPDHLKKEFGEDYKPLIQKTTKIIKRMRKMYGKS